MKLSIRCMPLALALLLLGAGTAMAAPRQLSVEVENLKPDVTFLAFPLTLDALTITSNTQSILYTGELSKNWVFLNYALKPKIFDYRRETDEGGLILRVVYNPKAPHVGTQSVETVDDAIAAMKRIATSVYPATKCLIFEGFYVFSGGTGSGPIEDFRTGFFVKNGEKQFYRYARPDLKKIEPPPAPR